MSYANRLVQAAEVIVTLKRHLPIGADGEALLPTHESQIRPLLTIADPEKQAEAWKRAAEASRGVPTAKEVAKAVVLHEDIQVPASAREGNSKAELVTRIQRTVSEGLERLTKEQLEAFHIALTEYKARWLSDLNSPVTLEQERRVA